MVWVQRPNSTNACLVPIDIVSVRVSPDMNTAVCAQFFVKCILQSRNDLNRFLSDRGRRPDADGARKDLQWRVL
jgi:hypothetical protein